MTCTFYVTDRPIAGHPDSPQWQARRFANPRATPGLGFFKSLAVMWNVLLNKPSDAVPDQAIPVDVLSRAQLEAAPDRSVFRLGHSTVLLKLRGHFYLTDPVFSERASPLQWLGPKRFHAPPIDLDELPPLKAVILSHDHYDHLDKATVRALAAKTERFLTPLGVGDTLIAWGMDADKVRQLDWWQGTELAGLHLVATPSQHFSGRGLLDGNKTLWASWVIIDDDTRIFFSGDSGYFEGFKAIGQKYGPFDLTLMETGAYDPQWPLVHMQPEETLQAHRDLRGRWLMPIHNGTFDLAMHSWHAPFERIHALAEQGGVPLVTPRMGEMLNVDAPHATSLWWRVRTAGIEFGRDRTSVQVGARAD